MTDKKITNLSTIKMKTIQNITHLSRYMNNKKININLNKINKS